jgi:hypothetical protein
VPIVGLTDVEGLPKLMSIRLGHPVHDPRTGRKIEGRAPSEHDHFALTPEDGVPEEVIELYGRTSKQLRIMLPEEFDHVPEGRDEEMVMSAYDRAYKSSEGLVCRGTGSSRMKPGVAWTTDEEWAKRISEVTRVAPEELADGRIQIRCLGRNCPKWFRLEKGEDGKMRRAPGTDRDSACRSTLVFRFYVIHPTTDWESPDYCRVLGGAQIASSSVNTIRDLHNGMRQVLRHTKHPRHPEGRTRAIPLTLIRKITPTQGGGVGRVRHFTLQILPTVPEWERASRLHPDAVWISVPQRREIMRALQEADEYVVVRDLLDGMTHERRLIGQAVEGATTDEGEPEPTSAVRQTIVDVRPPMEAGAAAPSPQLRDAASVEGRASGASVPRRPVGDHAPEEDDSGEGGSPTWELTQEQYEARVGPEGLTDEQLTRRLSKAEREVVKGHLAERMGRDPQDQGVLFELQRLIKAAHEAMGTAPPEGLTVSSMTVAIELWIRANLPAPRAAELEDTPVEEAETDEDDAEVAGSPEPEQGQSAVDGDDAENRSHEAPSLTLPGIDS